MFDPTRPVAASPAFAWSRGTDLRNSSGLYGWSPTTGPQVSPDTIWYPSVTTVLDETASKGMAEAQFWFIAEFVRECTRAAKARENVEIWHKRLEAMIAVSPVDLLNNALPERPHAEHPWEDATGVYWAMNEGLHQIQGSGQRELTRRANRGTIVHEAIAERAMMHAAGQQPDVEWHSKSLADYIAAKIADNNFAISVDYCFKHVVTALQWWEANVDEVHAYEQPVFSTEWCYAGTRDLDATLKDRDGLWRIDMKTSKTWYPSYALQIAAYDRAEFAAVPGAQEWYPMSPADHCASLLISEQPDGNVLAILREWKDVDADFEAFIQARALWQHLMDCRPPEKRLDVKPGRVVRPDPKKMSVPKPQSRRLERTLAREDA